MSLKNQLACWLLNRKYKKLKRTTTVLNLAEVKTVGILWKLDDQPIYNKLTKQLKEKGIKLSGLCFSDQADSVHGEMIFSSADFSFLGTLKNEQIAEYINQEFDLLIDISLADNTEIQYVRALSKARFKAGWSNTSPDYFDLSIDINNRQDAAYLAKQLIHYLSEINKK